MIERTASFRATVIVISLLFLFFAPAVQAERIVIEQLTAPGSFGDGIAKAAELFNETQDEIEIVVTFTPAGTEALMETLIVRMAGGILPDVVAGSGRFGEILGRDMARPLTEYFERDGLQSLLVPASVEQGIWNGDLYSLPFVAQPFITFYNGALFAEAGLATPMALHEAGDWTWQSLREAGQKLSLDRNNDGIHEIWGVSTFPEYLERLTPWLSQAGTWPFNEYVMATESNFTAPEVTETLMYIRSLVETDAMPPQAIRGAAGPFSQGQVAIAPDGPWLMGTVMSRENQPYDWGVAPVPMGPDNNVSNIHGGGMQMLSTTSNPDAAWEWMKFMSTDLRAIEVFVNEAGRPPALIDGLQVYLDLVGRNAPDNLHVIIDAIIGSDIAPPLVPVMEGINVITSDLLGPLMSYYLGDTPLTATIELIDQIATNHLQAR